MAEVRLADLIVPVDDFMPSVIRESIYVNAYFQSGLVAESPLLTQRASANEARLFDVPFLGRLPNTESNVSSDDPAVTSTPKKITSERERAIKHMRNDSWSSMDLAAALSVHGDPRRAIRSQIAQFWAEQYDLTLNNQWQGLIANNIANNASDMVVDISAVAAPGNVMSVQAAVNTMQTLGDHKDLVSICIMHSQVHATLSNLNAITTVDSREGPTDSNIQFETFLGHRIIMSDNATQIGGNYVTIFSAPGVIQFGRGAPATPTATNRIEEAGNGEGQEVIHSRNHFSFHPVGHFWADATIAGVSPSWTELRDPGNWDRVTDRKRIPWCACISAA